MGGTRQLTTSILRFAAGFDDRAITPDMIIAWDAVVSTTPSLTAEDWKTGVEDYYREPGVRRARPGDIRAAAKRVFDRRTGSNYLAISRRRGTPKPANFQQMVEDAKRERANPD